MAPKKATQKKALATILELTRVMNIAELSEKAAEHYGHIRAELQRSGQPIGNNDLWLAAQARSMDWTLVTNNEREFLRVPDLKVENWANA